MMPSSSASGTTASTVAAASLQPDDPNKVTKESVQMVQSLIEQCLVRYLSQSETIATLFRDARIEPSFTNLGMLEQWRATR